MAAVQRLRQGIRALTAFTRPVDNALTGRYLNPAQQALFGQLQRAEQQHSLNVLQMLLDEGPVPDDLAVAALLHDVGKARYRLAVWMKTQKVLLKKLTPALARRWADGDPRDPFKRGLVVGKHHPKWSAEMVAPTGVSERALWLIRHHQQPPAHLMAHPDYPLMQRLQRADDAN